MLIHRGSFSQFPESLGSAGYGYLGGISAQTIIYKTKRGFIWSALGAWGVASPLPDSQHPQHQLSILLHPLRPSARSLTAALALALGCVWEGQRELWEQTGETQCTALWPGFGGGSGDASPLGITQPLRSAKSEGFKPRIKEVGLMSSTASHTVSGQRGKSPPLLYQNQACRGQGVAGMT